MEREDSNGFPMVEEDEEPDYNTQAELEAGIDRYFLSLGQSKLRQNLKKLSEKLLKIFSKKDGSNQ